MATVRIPQVLREALNIILSGNDAHHLIKSLRIKVGEKIFTIEFLITDYVEHLEHHLKQVTDY